jgi:hypothetical protein
MHWGEDESVGDSWRVDEKKCLKSRPKHQTPNTKHQAPSTRETSNSKLSMIDQARGDQFGAWNLELLWSLDLGVWCFGH